MKKFFLFILILLIFFSAYTAWKIFGAATTTPNGEFFYIKTGYVYADVRKGLIDEKFLKNSFWFDQAAKVFQYKKVKAGRYKITKGMSIYHLVKMLKNGSQSPVNFVITKLRTKEDLAKKMGNGFEFDSLEAIQFLTNTDSLKNFGLDTNTVMTAVLPNTYTFFWNTTPGKVFRRLFSESQKFWTDERKEKASLLGLSLQQVYTLASIVDEETNIKTDKDTIASVYLNRYKKGMKLESCPTIKYAMKNFTLTRIYDKYLQTESPYNTYRNPGLTPGPICTPQPETIDLVLNVTKTDYLYFAAKSDLKGGTVFAKNYNDHMKNAREYQKALDKREAMNNK